MREFRKKVAIIDMYNGVQNKGMAGIKEIIGNMEFPLTYDLFNARGENELPDLSDYSIFISTGGPGNPIEEGSKWQERYFQFLDKIVAHNKENEDDKKHLFLICHSFQMACHHFGLGTISKRKSRSFGIYPVHQTTDGEVDPIFDNLDNPMWVIDSRLYQVIKSNARVFNKQGAKLLSLEKIRNHVELERAVMAIRFTDEIIGTQFHPEADQNTFFSILQDKSVREETIALRGKKKYYRMLDDLLDQEKVAKTYNTILPNFLKRAYQNVIEMPTEILYAAEV
ncbi:MAG: homoserine O-succinyltransferase [Saprospiraceae bacterium]|jgi:homoserine O-succinyltransferase